MYKKTTYLIIALIIIGAFLRFYNLNWGAPLYFHPDERNIATSVAQLNFPNQMNPHFFAYGSFPIYAIYFTAKLFSPNPNFDLAIMVSRFYSSIFSVLLIPLMFLLGKKIKDTKLGLLAATLTTFSVGFIQFAHFGTFEMWLTFFTVVLFYQCIKNIEEKHYYHPFFTSIAAGVLVSTKISHIAILPLSFGAIIFQEFFDKNKKQIFYKTIQSVVVVFLIYILTNPYVFLDTASFLSSIKYESALALGSLQVFYTGGFYNTIPILFQFLHIYPFLLNPVLTIILIPSFIYVFYQGIKIKNKSFLILVSFFLLLFLSQSFLFVKWTRYMIPTLPFAYLIIAIAVQDIAIKNRKAKQILTTVLITNSAIFALSYFVTAFAKPDSRIEAAKFARNNIPHNAKIISEPYDLGLMAFGSFINIKMIDFYNDGFNFDRGDYIVLPSQRLLRSRLLNKNEFPNGHKFYSELANNKSGYSKIYETPCDIFCKITYLNNPIFGFEETASVFDRPTVMIFKKQ